MLRDMAETHSLMNISAIVATIGLVVCLSLDLRKGINRILRGRCAVLVAVFVWFLLEALLVPDELRRYSQFEYDFGVFCVVISVAVFLFSYEQFQTNLFGAFARRLPTVGQPQVLWILVVGGMTIGVGSLLVYSGFDFGVLLEGLGAKKRWTGVGRGRYGSWGTIIYELQMFQTAVVPLAVALVFTSRASQGRRIIAGGFLIWFSLRALFSGTRSSMIPIILSIGAAIYWHSTPATRKKLVYAGLPLAVLGGLFWSAIMVAGRNDGEFNTAEAAKVKYVGYEMFRELLFVTRGTNDNLPLQYGMTYFTQLVNPIPRAIWKGKPVADAGLILARAYGAVDKNGEPTMTNSPGFIGEAYLNFGFFGMLIVPLVAGIVVRAWDDIFPIAARSLPGFLVYAGGIAIIFVSGRSFNMSAFYGLLSLFVLMVMFEILGLTNVPLQPAYAARRMKQHLPASS